MTELVSLREYGRRRGVSAMAVSKAAKTGRITLVGGKVDIAAADRDWPANTNPGQAAFKQVPPAGPVGGLSAAEEGGAVPSGEAEDEQPAGDGTAAGEQKKNTSGAAYGQARAIREGYMARLAKIDYEEKTGSLVSADAVRVAAFNAARAARDSLLSMPDRLAPVLAGEANQFEVHRLLSEEIRRVCDELANAKSL